MTDDENDPLARSYRMYKRKLRRWLLIAVILLAMAWFKGIPHVQTTYTYYGSKSAGWLPAERKVDAWYFSVTGWQHVHSGQYGNDGCPFVMFIPLDECVDLNALAKKLSPFSTDRS